MWPKSRRAALTKDFMKNKCNTTKYKCVVVVLMYCNDTKWDLSMKFYVGIFNCGWFIVNLTISWCSNLTKKQLLKQVMFIYCYYYTLYYFSVTSSFPFWCGIIFLLYLYRASQQYISSREARWVLLLSVGCQFQSCSSIFFNIVFSTIIPKHLRRP